MLDMMANLDPTGPNSQRAWERAPQEEIRACRSVLDHISHESVQGDGPLLSRHGLNQQLQMQPPDIHAGG